MKVLRAFRANFWETAPTAAGAFGAGAAFRWTISLVCKVTSANGRPAVKLSDNPEKSTGDAREIERYRRVFGTEGQIAQPVRV